MTTHVHSSISNKILTIRLQRPEKKNAFTEAMYQAATEALLEATSNTDVHAVLFCADGAFSAGNDLKDFLKNPPQSESAAVFQFMFAFTHCPVPIVAAVNGLAIGIGTTLLLHCDFAYAGDNTIFSMPFIKLALLPEFGSTLLLQQRAGYLKAAEMLLLGDNFDAQVALNAGIISAIFAPEDVETTAQKTCDRLAKTPREVLVQTKALLRREPEPLPERIRQEAREFMNALNSPNAKAAFMAILNK